MDFVPFDPDAQVDRQRRHLPHWEQARRTYFVTFRLADSIPKAKLDVWREEKARWEASHPKPWSSHDWQVYRENFLDRIERWSDRGFGACPLKIPALRKIVVDALLFFAEDPNDTKNHAPRYCLSDFVVMPNHVHLLVTPLPDWKLSQLLHSWKSFTAHGVNKALDRSGCLWMDERFDHLVRDRSFLTKYQRYIAENPIKANLSESEFTHWTIT